MRGPLHEVHQAQGATFTEYQGWELPDQFTDPVEEYQAVRHSLGVIDVSYRATIKLTGPDRTDFLHRILSNGIENLLPGAGRHAALLSVQGKLMSVMKVLATDDAIGLETEPVARRVLFDKLGMYKLAQKVELEDVTEAVAKLLVQGPNSTELLRTVVNQEVALDEELQHQAYQIAEWGKGRGGEWENGRMGEEKRNEGVKGWRGEGVNETITPAPPPPHTPPPLHSLRLIRVHETGEVGYEVIVPAAQASSLWARLSQSGAAFGLRPIGFQAFNRLRLEAGIPWYGVDMDDSHFPQEARMDYVLDWNKGCYVGQEPVARIKYRGHVNKRLMGLRFPEGTQPESRNKILKNDREIGHVTSAAYSPHLNCPIALGYVRREFFEPGTEVTVETAGGSTTAMVTEPPFYESSTG